MQIIPGLRLDSQDYELAAAALAQYAPDLAPLTWAQFTAPEKWALIPDPTGAAYKAERVVQRTMARTLKFNLWFRPDLRAGETPRPHSHPWDTFTSHILRGGYEEIVYTPASHTAGDSNRIARDDYHEVTAIHAPGKTLTLMVCGLWSPGWGYLDPASGAYASHNPGDDPEFEARFRTLNPHLN